MIFSRWFWVILSFILLHIGSIHSAFARQQPFPDELTTSSMIFNFNVDTAFVQFKLNDPKILKVANGDTLYLQNGFYHMFLSYPTNEDEYITRNVLKDSVYNIEHNFDRSQKVIDLDEKNASIRYLIGGDVVALSDSNSKILLGDDQTATQFGIFKMKQNRQSLTFRNQDFYDKEFDIKRSDKVIFKSHFFYPDQGSFTAIELIPGVSQLKRNEYVKMGLIFTGFLASATLSIRYQKDYREQLDVYEEVRNKYLLSENPAEALRAGDEMQLAYKDLKPYLRKRNYSLLAIFGVLIYDTVDKISALKKYGQSERKTFEFYLYPVFDKYITAGAKIKF